MAGCPLRQAKKERVPNAVSVDTLIPFLFRLKSLCRCIEKNCTQGGGARGGRAREFLVGLGEVRRQYLPYCQGLQQRPSGNYPSCRRVNRRTACINKKTGDVLFSRAVSSQVHSALRGLTSVFGMGTGGSLLLLSPVWLSVYCTLTTTQHSPQTS